MATTAAATVTVDVTTERGGGPPYNVDPLKLANTIIQTSILAFLMVAMGCVISIKDLKTACRRPVGVLVGFASQFVIMPLLTFSLAHAMQMEGEFAIGMLVIGCCPGGTVSNLFTYWTEGDVGLSIVMTTASTILAFGMMPLNLFIYSRSWTDGNSVIPYTQIVTALASILLPVGFGLIIHYKFKKLAPFVIQLGTIFGVLGIAVGVVLNGFINPAMFSSGWKVWFAAVMLPFCGFFCGYGLARILKQSHNKCRTIAFETGSQNVALAQTLIFLTFTDTPNFNDLITYPSLYAIFIFVDGLMCVLVFRLIMRVRGFQRDTNVSGEAELGASNPNLEHTPDKHEKGQKDQEKT